MNERYIIDVCPECGTEFSTEFRSAWGWKNVKGQNVCSYHCQRASETNRKPASSRIKRVPVRIVETGEVFESINQCAYHLGASYSMMHKCIYKGETYKKMHIERVV